MNNCATIAVYITAFTVIKGNFCYLVEHQRLYGPHDMCSGIGSVGLRWRSHLGLKHTFYPFIFFEWVEVYTSCKLTIFGRREAHLLFV